MRRLGRNHGSEKPKRSLHSSDFSSFGALFSKVMLCVDCDKSVENSQDDKDAFLVETILEEVNEH